MASAAVVSGISLLDVGGAYQYARSLFYTIAPILLHRCAFLHKLRRDFAQAGAEKWLHDEKASMLLFFSLPTSAYAELTTTMSLQSRCFDDASTWVEEDIYLGIH